MSYIHRHLETLLPRLSRTYGAILLTGPRQSGKTTMLKKLAEQEGAGRGYVTLDDLAERELATTDPKTFLQLYKPPILIDEVQYAPELFTYIKMHIDSFHKPGAFWLTGSQIFRLMRGVRESLAGRVALLHMAPLSQREIDGVPCAPFVPDLEKLQSTAGLFPPRDVNKLFERIWQGSMPGLVSGAYADRDIYYASYLSTYVERDVRDISGAVDALKFHRFVTAAAARCAQLVNYKAMADDADIDVTTAKSWLNILETLGIVFLLHPYSNNVLKRTIKTPKLYFYDCGLVCYLTRWSSPEVAERGAMNGALLENFTVSEIVKGYHNAGREPYVYYYRDRDAKEIDVILEQDGTLFPLEIKKSASPDRRVTRVFSVLDKGPLRRGTGAVLCTAEALGAFDRDHLIIPIRML